MKGYGQGYPPVGRQHRRRAGYHRSARVRTTGCVYAGMRGGPRIPTAVKRSRCAALGSTLVPESNRLYGRTGRNRSTCAKTVAGPLVQLRPPSLGHTGRSACTGTVARPLLAALAARAARAWSQPKRLCENCCWDAVGPEPPPLLTGCARPLTGSVRGCPRIAAVGSVGSRWPGPAGRYANVLCLTGHACQGRRRQRALPENGLAVGAGTACLDVSRDVIDRAVQLAHNHSRDGWGGGALTATASQADASEQPVNSQ